MDETGMDTHLDNRPSGYTPVNLDQHHTRPLNHNFCKSRQTPTDVASGGVDNSSCHVFYVVQFTVARSSASCCVDLSFFISAP